MEEDPILYTYQMLNILCQQDSIIQHLPNFNELGRKTKYNLNPDHIPDLSWQLATTLNTNPKVTLSYATSQPKLIVTNNMNDTPRLVSTKG